MSENEAKTTKTEAKETKSFQTEVTKLLDLMIHSLYSNKEIFLRELISNASDATEKLRYEAIDNEKLTQGDTELKIKIDLDKDAKTITITDNGIGMSYDEVIDNIGTIAKSGTSEFFSKLTGDKAKDSELIGQFGVGFYSAFMVADKIIVLTRRAGEDASKGVRWESTGDGKYTIEHITKATRGTEIILHMKKDADEFLDNYRLRGIISKYSDHISFPISMIKPPEYDKDGKEKKTDKVEYETVNQAKALWTRSKSEVKDDEYQAFFKDTFHEFKEPLAWSHNRVEGKHEYTSLLYIPSQAPFDLWDRDRKSGLKLYIQRVFIMDNADIMPGYLRFMKGIIDSNDLPLNISREILQDNIIVDKIRSGSVKKTLSMLEKMAKNDKEKYAEFWKAFGQVIKEGPGEDQNNKEQINKLLRFASTNNSDEAQNVSLDEYISRMKKEQKHIYYITAESYHAAKNSPHLEIFKKEGIEVLLLSDRVDEWLVSHLTEYEGKTLQSVTKGALDLGEKETKEEKEKHEKTEKDFAAVIKQMQKTLDDKVKEVRITHRLTDSPSCIVADDNDMSLHLKRLMEQAGQGMPADKVILELNPDHKLVQHLKDEQDDDAFAQWSKLLFEQALLAEGGQLDDPATFVKRMNTFLSK